jgi:hypothetical protein
LGLGEAVTARCRERERLVRSVPLQQSYDAYGESTPDVSVKADEAAIRFRRLLEQQLLRETAASDPTSVIQMTVGR